MLIARWGKFIFHVKIFDHMKSHLLFSLKAHTKQQSNAPFTAIKIQKLKRFYPVAGTDLCDFCSNTENPSIFKSKSCVHFLKLSVIRFSFATHFESACVWPLKSQNITKRYQHQTKCVLLFRIKVDYSCWKTFIAAIKTLKS